MSRKHEKIGDSRIGDHGFIPGLEAQPAFRTEVNATLPIPVVIAVPHAGRAYPESLLSRMRNPGLTCLRLEDRHVDRVAIAVARQTGASLLVADAPRAMIDLNRSLDEMDWDMVVEEPSGDGVAKFAGIRARGGLGLVPRRLGGVGEIWKSRLDRAELDHRIAGIHNPYHDTLAQILAAVSARWGAALLLDIHSMPPLPVPAGRSRADLVLGDRFGGSCSGTLISSAFDYFAGEGVFAAYNRPYAGGYVLDRHGDPARGIHAIQIEICKSRYLDSRLAEPSAGLPAIAEMISGLVRVLAGEIATRGRDGGSPSRQMGIAAE
jgi:N-formylglutamate amidohydrolase